MPRRMPALGRLKKSLDRGLPELPSLPVHTVSRETGFLSLRVGSTASLIAPSLQTGSHRKKQKES